MTKVFTNPESPTHGETSPLLTSVHPQETAVNHSAETEHNKIYDRFSKARKRCIVLMVAVTGFFPFFVAGSFVPSIPQIAQELHSTEEVVGLGVSISVLVESVAALICATYSTFYGRRPAYLYGLPLLIGGSVGVGYAQDVASLMFWRVIQALGAAGGITLGAGVIGDIYKLEERGMVTGIYFSSILLGNGLAPPAGGLATYYGTWRDMQYGTAIAAGILFVSMLFFYPETIQPHERGLNKYNAKRDEPRSFVLINPFGSLTTLRAPTLLAMIVPNLFAIVTDFVLFVPMADTIGAKYGITNEFVMGACFLPRGLGMFCGAPMAGAISDRLIKKWRKKRNEWVPEDRLRGAFVSAATLVPLSVLISGLATRYIPGVAGLVVNLICFYFNGMGIAIALNPVVAYGVDIMHHRSAETLAAISAVRGILTAVAVAGIIPAMHTYGVVWTNTLSAAAAWIGSLVLWIVIHYGGRLREWSNVEYSTLAST